MAAVQTTCPAYQALFHQQTEDNAIANLFECLKHFCFQVAVLEYRLQIEMIETKNT